MDEFQFDGVVDGGEEPVQWGPAVSTSHAGADIHHSPVREARPPPGTRQCRPAFEEEVQVAEVGQGAVFRFCLPCALAEAPQGL